MINGIINVYKEPGWTSSDVVVKLRHILGCRRVGHTGTLDPMASGVLPVCVGEATAAFQLYNGQAENLYGRLFAGACYRHAGYNGECAAKAGMQCDFGASCKSCWRASGASLCRCRRCIRHLSITGKSSTSWRVRAARWNGRREHNRILH